MKHLLRHSWVYLILSVVSSTAYGHIAVDHGFSPNNGFLHLLSDPVHFFPLLTVVFLMIVMRKQLASIVKRIVGNYFR
jgi:hypothetical protein